MAKIDWGEKLELKIRMLPESPGCYLMKDKDGTIIYIGKAVNLKNRVRSYFRDTEHTPKVAAMISHIDDFDILLCDSNLEALCLECNLIKLHKPYYNILLKDDKHYPYLRVNLKEPFPRLTLARRMEKDGAKYFGPYIGATAVRQVIDAVRGVFPLRTCRKELPLKTPCRPCVNYEIGKCLAPCAGKCTEEQYWDMMDGVLAFLGGDYKQVLDVLNREMMDYAAKMQYERAAVIRDKIRDVQGLMERQIAIQTDRSEQDILAIAQDGLDAMIQLVYVRGGRMVGGDHFALPREGSEPAGDVLAEFLTQYYQEGNLIPRNILVQELPDGAQPQLEQWLRQQKGAAVTLVTPRRGEKHDLVLLAAKNAHDALEKRNARASIREERTIGAAAALGKALGLPDNMVYRQPFPGPGLGVRCIGAITRDRLEAVRESDAILREEFAKNGLEGKVWQYFTVVPDIKSTGIIDGKRSFDWPVIIRAVNTVDAVTAEVAQLDFGMMQHIVDRITHEVSGVNRVLWDLTPKPTGTIEWE